jgi:prolyl-tRNA editing enzyme YbaK/EbsC (Cys-tRNA(Pro) deacylase)
MRSLASEGSEPSVEDREVTDPTEANDPAAVEGRVRGFLDRLGREYEVVACDPAYADTAAFCERYGVAPEDSANTIVVVGKGAERTYVACVVLATTRLDVNGAVRQRLGVRKASFASAEETVERTGMMIGGVTVLALPGDMAVWVDARVMARPSIVLGGGSRSMKIRVPPDVLLAVPGAAVVEGLAR